MEIQDVNHEKAILNFGDFRERMKEIEDESIDLIVTDPMQSTDYDYLWGELVIESYRVLKHRRSIFVMVDQRLIPEVIYRFRVQGFFYNWICLLPSWHGDFNDRLNVKKSFMPCVWFSKGRHRLKKMMNDDLSRHVMGLDFIYGDCETWRWKEGLDSAVQPIWCATEKNEVVLDPMMGRGTTGVVALKMGRRFIGIESEEQNFITAEERIHKEIDQWEIISGRRSVFS
jgi:hypothetical protein